MNKEPMQNNEPNKEDTTYIVHKQGVNDRKHKPVQVETALLEQWQNCFREGDVNLLIIKFEKDGLRINNKKVSKYVIEQALYHGKSSIEVSKAITTFFLLRLKEERELASALKQARESA